jgi:hypothetical protein
LLDAVTSLIDKRFQPGRTPETDPQCPDTFIDEFIEQWWIQARNAYKDAYHKLRVLAVGAHEHFLDDLERKQNKEHAQLQVAVDRQLKQRDNENRQREQEVQRNQKELEREKDQLDRLKRQIQQDEEKEREQQRRDQQERYDQLYEQAELDHELWVYKDERLPKPFTYPTDTSRHAGTWILGNSGKGKTVLMHHLAYRDGTQTDAALLFVDNKQDFVAPLKTWPRIHDRLVLIEPSNDFLFALNPLDIPRANVNHTVELIDHLLSSLVESELSGAQTLFFRNVVPALMNPLIFR